MANKKIKVILHMAISADGYVAKKDGDSGWVSPIDEKLFLKRCSDAGCLIVGRNTYEQYKNEIYPVQGVVNIILTKKPFIGKGVFCAKSPKAALKIAAKNGFHKVLLAGGGLTSASFLKQGLINELFLTVHPLALGGGIKLFEQVNSSFKFELINVNKLKDGLVQLHYKVKN